MRVYIYFSIGKLKKLTKHAIAQKLTSKIAQFLRNSVFGIKYRFIFKIEFVMR